MRRRAATSLVAALALALPACDELPTESIHGEPTIQRMEINPDSVRVAVGDSVQIRVSLLVTTGPLNPTTSFESQDFDVASVKDEGWVHGRSPGSTTVIVTAAAGVRKTRGEAHVTVFLDTTGGS